LIVVDNGSEDGSRQFAIDEADIAVLHDDNPGFAVGMNAGLARASGDYIAFINNDTQFPEQWSEQILATAGSSQDMGIVLPAVTKAGNPVSVREHPGESIQRLIPFAEFPSGVVYVMRRQLIESLGGWNQAYVQASAEDLDLAFTVWAHGLNIFLDERVLVEHESQASVRHLEGRKALYRQNLEQFLDTWEDPTQHRRLLDTIDDEAFVHNLERAQTAAIWIRRTLEARDDANDLKLELLALSEVQTPARRWFRSRS
jgi:GT2 family glycosyltransferase